MAESARVLCINPCPPSFAWPPVALEGLSLPGLGTKVKPIMQMNLKGGCDGCEVSVNFLLQLQPFLISLEMPLCLLSCLLRVAGPDTYPITGTPWITDPYSVIFAMKGLIKDLPAPDLVGPLKSIAAALHECMICFLGWSPFMICCMLRDVIDIIVALLKCIIGILRKILTINLRIAGLQMDPQISIQKTAKCLAGLVRVQNEMLNARIDVLGTLLKALVFLFKFAGVNIDINKISANLEALTPYTPIPAVVATLNLVIDLLGEKGKGNGARVIVATCCELGNP